MPSAIWSGSVGFGLVQVPVRLVSATRSRDVSFNQLEEGTGSRIRYRKVSEATGEEVPAERIVKGYEFSKGQYVVVEPDELSALAPKASHTIDIEEFVDLAEIDPLYFEQPYYLVPDKKGEKAYRLLVDAMEELQKVAIGRIVIRAKERLVAVRPLDGMLCVETMRYSDEVVSREGLAPEAVEVGARELAMARQLVESLAVDRFEPEKFRDEYREQVLDLVERKAAGEEIVAPPASEAPAKVLDLVAALEASLEKAAGARDRHPSQAGLSVAEGDGDGAAPAREEGRQGPGEGHEGDQVGREGPREEDDALEAQRLKPVAGFSSGGLPRRSRSAGRVPTGEAPHRRFGDECGVVVGQVPAVGADRLVVLQVDPERVADLEGHAARHDAAPSVAHLLAHCRFLHSGTAKLQRCHSPS